MVRQRAGRRDGDFKTTLWWHAKCRTVWPITRGLQAFPIFRTSGWEIFAPDSAKATAPVIKPHLETFVGESLLNDDVVRAVPVYIQGRYCQRGFVRFEGKVSIPTAREMELYCSEAALRLPMIDKDGAIEFIVAVEIGSRYCPSPEMCQPCGIRPRKRAFKPVLRPEEGCHDGQQGGHGDVDAK
jgi:hypothetical protein